MRHLVQIHAHCRLDVKTNTDPATLARLCYFQVPAEVGGDEVRSIWYSVSRETEELGDSLKRVLTDSLSEFQTHLRLTTALEHIS